MATGFGAELVGTTHGGRARIREYYVTTSESNNLYKGDFVELVKTTGAMNSAIDGIPANTVAAIQQAATGDELLGVIVGFEPLGAAGSPFTDVYRAASTARRVLVCDDPDAVYRIQEDALTAGGAAGGAVTAALIGAMANANFVYAAGNTRNGASGTMLDSSSTTASAADLKILGVDKTPGNVGALTAGAVLLCKILDARHALRATDSQS